MSGISRRTSPLGAFTYRELLAQRRRLQKAIARRGEATAASRMLGEVEGELAARREAKLVRAGTVPSVD